MGLLKDAWFYLSFEIYEVKIKSWIFPDDPLTFANHLLIIYGVFLALLGLFIWFNKDKYTDKPKEVVVVE